MLNPDCNPCTCIDPFHVCGNAAKLEYRTIRLFYRRRKFPLFCPPVWLHSHRRERGLYQNSLSHYIVLHSLFLEELACFGIFIPNFSVCVCFSFFLQLTGRVGVVLMLLAKIAFYEWSKTSGSTHHENQFVASTAFGGPNRLRLKPCSHWY